MVHILTLFMRMLGCLGMIFFLGLFIVLSLGMSVVGTVLRLLGFSWPKVEERENVAPSSTSASQTTKTIPDDEGEYIDFEEVK